MWKSHPGRQCGMALIAVLWLVAAMGIVITGVVKSVRLEARSVGLQRQVAITSAVADAAILLALQKLQSQPLSELAATSTLAVNFSGKLAQVHAIPLNGLIDINRASVSLLADLYRYVGGLHAEAALALAQATLDVRQAKNSKGIAIGFDATEDLLKVPGFTYNLYAKIITLITAELTNGSGRVNPRFSPYGVLLVLSGGDAARASALFSQRDIAPVAFDTSFFKPESIEMTTIGSLKLQVVLTLPDGSALQKGWIVSMTSDLRTGLPWRVLRTSQTVLPAVQSVE